MKVGLYSIKSPILDATHADNLITEFIKDLENDSNLEIQKISVEDFRRDDILPVILVLSGGTEGEFKKYYDEMKEPFILLATNNNNSLAASMEIVSFLRKYNKKSEIVHGSKEYILKRINTILKIEEVKNKLSKLKLGVVGQPSDWLIASDVDYDVVKKNSGIELIDITMDELKEEIGKKHKIDNEYTSELMKKEFPVKEIEKALYIYGAFKALINKYDLQGITVRCFDLLEDVKSTGCLGLAILNAEGYISACEGDIPALISMTILNYLTGEPVFQANPSRISVENNEIVFAHCTLPINMPVEYKLDTHFESGIGAAVKGKIKTGDATIFKISNDLSNYFVSNAQILENLNDKNLCRTQIVLKPEESVQYFLTESIGNHHIICKGLHKEIINEFLKNR